MDNNQIKDLINQLTTADEPAKINIIYDKLITIAASNGINLASIYPVYKKIADQKITGFTIPAINLRAITFDFARIIFKIAIKYKSPLFLIEIARSEQKYTNQPPKEFISYIVAAAISENYPYPIFIQGDHYQINPTDFKNNPNKEIDNLKNLIQQSINAGFYNIDIDASTLVNYNYKTVDQQQNENSRITAELIRYIREIEPKDTPVNIGGEIGHIGGTNSTPEEVETYINQLSSYLGSFTSISKLSIQTGTSHGGQIDSQGNVQLMTVDFDLINRLGKLVKDKYQLAGVVQHGASTLPENLFSKFVIANTLEIHLSTKFQNIIFDNLPEQLRTKMYNFLFRNYLQQWDHKWTEAQFIYRTRKKILGNFKKELFNLDPENKNAILYNFENTVNTIFNQLNITNTDSFIS